MNIVSKWNYRQLKNKNFLELKKFFLGIYGDFESFSFSLNSTMDISSRGAFSSRLKMKTPW